MMSDKFDMEVWNENSDCCEAIVKCNLRLIWDSNIWERNKILIALIANINSEKFLICVNIIFNKVRQILHPILQDETINIIRTKVTIHI